MYLFDTLTHPERIPHDPTADGSLLAATMMALGWSFDGCRWHACNGLMVLDRHPCGATDLLGFVSPAARRPALVVPLDAGTPDVVVVAVLCALMRDLTAYLNRPTLTVPILVPRARGGHSGRRSQRQGGGR